MTFKLFIWLGILKNYASEFAFAFAERVEDARALVLEQLREETKYDEDEDTYYYYKADIDKINGEPDEIITTPCAELVHGGE